ncbi:hypothetical protein COOONC_16384, partial [Cooperia oncophora]
MTSVTQIEVMIFRYTVRFFRFCGRICRKSDMALVKTRLQLYQGKSTILNMIRRVYKREGIKGFYKGVTASYAGVSETMIQFVIYEHLRGLLLRHHLAEGDKEKMDFLNFMVAGGCAKFIACVIA